MSADEAAAELDLLATAHRPQPRRTARGPRRDAESLSAQRVAERALQGTGTSDADATRFFEAMVPAERIDFMEQVAEKLADVALGHVEGLVQAFNKARAGVNSYRRLVGIPELPAVELKDPAAVRSFLQMGMEHGLEAGAHQVLEAALHAVFGEPSQLPQADDPANPLGPLPALERIEGVRFRFSGSF